MERALAAVVVRVVVVLQVVPDEELALRLRAEDEPEADVVERAPRERVQEVRGERVRGQERERRGVAEDDDELEVRCTGGAWSVTGTLGCITGMEVPEEVDVVQKERVLAKVPVEQVVLGHRLPLRPAAFLRRELGRGAEPLRLTDPRSAVELSLGFGVRDELFRFGRGLSFGGRWGRRLHGRGGRDGGLAAVRLGPLVRRLARGPRDDGGARRERLALAVRALDV